MPSPPALVMIAARRPFGSGWLDRSAAASTSSSSVRARRTPAWRNSASTAVSAPASAAVWELAARAPAPVVPAFKARIGFLRATRRGDAPELARVAERLQIEEDEVGLLVVLPALEQVVRGDVGLVADRDERREAEVRARRPSRAARGRGRRSATRSAIRPGGSARGAKVAFRPIGGDGDAEAVRPDEARAVRADEREQCSWRARPSRPTSAKPDEMTHSARDAGAQRRAGGLSDLRAGDADDGEVDGAPMSATERVSPDAGDGLAAPVDGIGRAGEVGGEDVAKQLAADRAAAAGGADDGDRSGRRTGAARRPRRRDRARRRGRGSVRRGDREADLDLSARRASRLTSKPASAKTRSMWPFSAKTSATKRLDARASCEDGELLEQTCADAVTLQVVGDGEGDLRRLDVAQACVLGDRDGTLAVGFRDGRDQRAAAVRIEEVLDQGTVDLASTVEARMQARRGQAGIEGDESVTVGGRGRAQSQSCAVAENDVNELSPERCLHDSSLLDHVHHGFRGGTDSLADNPQTWPHCSIPRGRPQQPCGFSAAGLCLNADG